ncbi:MAG: peptidase M36, partial [Actinomycetia bacterium]|nr:peptidase M36 [Actinomycetes bacterium]
MGKKSCILAASVAAVTGLGMIGPGPASSAQGPPDQGDDSPALSANGRERTGFYDSREGTPAQQTETAIDTATNKRSASVRTLRRSVGDDAMVSIDSVTGTPRNLASRDGYLTPTSATAPRRVALRYVRQHASALGLKRDDVSTFHLRKSYTDPAGTTHLAWTQVVDGVQVFGNGLEAHVTDAGELISLQGAPVSGLGAMTTDESTTPAITAESARDKAAENVGGEVDSDATRRATRSTTAVWSNGDRAELVWFADGDDVRLGWNTFTQAGDTLTYTHVVDATTGDV